MSDDLKILFFGDIVGRPGRKVVQKFLENNRQNYDFVIANVENASHGFGLTQKNHDEILNFKVDCMTSGNHIWDKKEIFQYIASSENLIRPLNYPNCQYGVGYRLFQNKILVVNMLGRTFMNSYLCPFETLKKLSESIDFNDKIVIVDFHAEATAEKNCFAIYASKLNVACVLGTHTHTQTADEMILNKKCAYITDVGFCGAHGGVIGMEYEGSITQFQTMLPSRYEIFDKAEKSQICAVEVIFDTKKNCAKKIKRIFEISEEKNES